MVTHLEGSKGRGDLAVLLPRKTTMHIWSPQRGRMWMNDASTSKGYNRWPLAWTTVPPTPAEWLSMCLESGGRPKPFTAAVFDKHSSELCDVPAFAAEHPELRVYTYAEFESGQIHSTGR